MIKTFVFLVALFTSMPSLGQDVKTFIPVKAYKILPVLKQEGLRIMPDNPRPAAIAALAEQESCIHLTHSRCMDQMSRLKTHAEEGAGIFQLTRTWRSDGSIRFDTLTELSNRYRQELRELTWSTVYQRPDLQIRAGILLVRENYRAFPEVGSDTERLKFAINAYNGGRRDLNRARTACGLAKGCDPGIYFDHVERYSVKSKNNLSGLNRSAYVINREHSRNIWFLRLPKYEAIWDSISLPK